MEGKKREEEQGLDNSSWTWW